MLSFITTLKIITWCNMGLDLACLVLYAIHFFCNEKHIEPLMQKLLWLSTVIHFGILASRGLYFSRHPMGNAFEAIFSFALVISILYIYIEKHINVRDTGLIVLSIAFVFRLSALLGCNFNAPASSLLDNKLFAYHSGAAIIGCASLLIASIYGFLYIVLYWKLKHSNFNRIFDRLPSLEILNEMNIHAAWYGFWFFSASLIFGMRWWKLQYGTYFSNDPKIILGFITCAVYAIGIIGHKFAGWNGKRLAYLSILGFSIILFSATIVNLLFSTIHGTSY